ncbi:MAG: DNA-protecting protein DprA [Bifidobacteriaceae bacterium]|jgi:DNA processing protein|nr:DNA-protecting protein DprA [Bifidobacteriaceae bacterium]
MSLALPFDLDDPLLARLAWSRIAEPGDRDASALVRAAGPSTALRWLAAEPRDPAGGLSDGSARGLSRIGVARVRDRWRPRLEGLDPRGDLRALAALGGTVLAPGQPGWPPGLDDLGDAAPICLWVRAGDGVAETLGRRLTPAAAVVGTRASTAYGETVTGQIVTDLVGCGVAVISGGAFGIDAAAHRAALAGGGFTVAVMAGGLDRLYPAGNELLLRAVAKEGALISEVPPGAAPRRERFLQRNRLIAALAAVTVVAESGWRSGSHRTARDAADLMRPVAAVPGPVTAASSAGCHKLIREGVATLVTGGDEVRELMAPMGQAALLEPAGVAGLLDGLGPVDRQVLDALPRSRGAAPTAVVLASGLATHDVLGALGRLERAGRAVSAGGLWRRAAAPVSRPGAPAVALRPGPHGGAGSAGGCRPDGGSDAGVATGRASGLGEG